MTRGGEDRCGPCSIANAMTTVLDPHPPIPSAGGSIRFGLCEPYVFLNSLSDMIAKLATSQGLQVPCSVGVSRG
jgi:hypothetical protein